MIPEDRGEGGVGVPSSKYPSRNARFFHLSSMAQEINFRGEQIGNIWGWEKVKVKGRGQSLP